jgi:hypothetical protein
MAAIWPSAVLPASRTLAPACWLPTHSPQTVRPQSCRTALRNRTNKLYQVCDAVRVWQRYLDATSLVFFDATGVGARTGLSATTIVL